MCGSSAFAAYGSGGRTITDRVVAMAHPPCDAFPTVRLAESAAAQQPQAWSGRCARPARPQDSAHAAPPRPSSAAQHGGERRCTLVLAVDRREERIVDAPHGAGD